MGTGIFFQCDDPHHQHARMPCLGGNMNISVDLRVALCVDGGYEHLCHVKVTETQGILCRGDILADM